MVRGIFPADLSLGSTLTNQRDSSDSSDSRALTTPTLSAASSSSGTWRLTALPLPLRCHAGILQRRHRLQAGRGGRPAAKDRRGLCTRVLVGVEELPEMRGPDRGQGEAILQFASAPHPPCSPTAWTHPTLPLAPCCVIGTTTPSSTASRSSCCITGCASAFALAGLLLVRRVREIAARGIWTTTSASTSAQ